MNLVKILFIVIVIMTIQGLQAFSQQKEVERKDDISELLESPALLKKVVEESMKTIAATSPRVEALVAVEGRDFILASILAYKLKLPLILYRRLSKLPVHPDPRQGPQAISLEVVLGEGGKDKKEIMAIHSDALKAGQKVAVVGSYLYGDYPVEGAKTLVKTMGAEVVQTLCFPLSSPSSLPIENSAQLASSLLRETVVKIESHQRSEMIRLLSDPSTIRTIPNWPKEGIAFKDITTLLLQPEKFQMAVDLMVDEFRQQKINGIWAMESRGFLFAPVAYELGVPLYPVHKKGKILGKAQSQRIDLEYGSDEIEVSLGANRENNVHQGEKERAVVVDDLIATGGTLEGACTLAQRMGWNVTSAACLIELPELKGRERLYQNTKIPSVAFLQFADSTSTQEEELAASKPKLRVAVTSVKNVKLAPVKRMMEKYFPSREIHLEGFSVPSGVAAQPLGAEMGLKGARQRIEHLRQEWHKRGMDEGKWDYVVSVENFFAPGEKNWSDHVGVAIWDVKNNHLVEEAAPEGALVEAHYGRKFLVHEEIEKLGTHSKGGEASHRTVGKMIRAAMMSRGEAISDENWQAHPLFGGRSREEWILEQIGSVMGKVNPAI